MDFDFTKARAEIQQWIVDFVEKPNPLLNGWAPCPYARQARINNEVNIRMGLDPYFDLKKFVRYGMDRYDVIALVYNPDRWPLAEFRALWTQAEQEFLSGQGLYVLEDHPSEQEQVLGVTMNQGTYAILFVQKKEKLEDAARQLAKKGYYNDWPEEYLAGLFRDREDPRS